MGAGNVTPLLPPLSLRAIEFEDGVKLNYNRKLGRAESINLWLHLKSYTPSKVLPAGYEPSDKTDAADWEPSR